MNYPTLHIISNWCPCWYALCFESCSTMTCHSLFYVDSALSVVGWHLRTSFSPWICRHGGNYRCATSRSRTLVHRFRTGIFPLRTCEHPAALFGVLGWSGSCLEGGRWSLSREKWFWRCTASTFWAGRGPTSKLRSGDRGFQANNWTPRLPLIHKSNLW